ncbi:MAG: PglZ domain-containing protein [Chloroflexales bacterium]|nr:PglZ domain-containing protein [Chloroflexales bacterium]
MGHVASHLQRLIARQLDESRLVLWFDPEGHYTEFLSTLQLANTPIMRYDGSFLALRHAIDPLLAGDAPPRLLVYVPLAEEATENALVELTAIAAVLKPGQSPVQRNTKLALVARHALRDVIGADKAAELERQVEAGRLSLADLELIGEADGGSAVIKSIFATSVASDVALAFLSGERFDRQLAARNALDELAQLFARAFALTAPSASDPVALRAALAQQALTVEFLAGLDRVPPELVTIPLPADPDQLQACVDLARTWRMRRDLQGSYIAHAERVEQTLDLARVAFSLDEIRATETFVCVEATLQAAVEQALRDHLDPELLILAQERLRGFWAEQRPALGARWALVVTAGLLLAEAARIERELKGAPSVAAQLLRRYTGGEQPWCLLDTHQRNLERRWHTFELGNLTAYQTLEGLVTRARQRFMDVGDALASAFVRALADARFAIPDVPRQRDIFASVVRRAMQAEKTAYVLVDALRYEMARELCLGLDKDYPGTIEPAIGTVPGITEIGMAALMPGAEGQVAVVPAGPGKVGLQIGETLLHDRESRMRWLGAQAGAPVAITTLEAVLEKPRKADLQRQLDEATLVVVTSQEIDKLAEGDNIRLARKAMDDTLADLSQLIRRLTEVGCKTIVITADHGYLFGDALDSDMKIDPPTSQRAAVDLHRRVWIGRGGAADEGYLRTSLAQFGLSNDLDIAVPWGFGAFKVSGGARAYFHGGMSPQELITPILVARPAVTGQATPLSAISWELTTGSRKITTLFFSMQIKGRSAGLFALDPLRVRVEIHSRGEVISELAAATYGLVDGAGEVELLPSAEDPQRIEPNTVTLSLTGKPGKTVSVHLVDAATGRELGRIDKLEAAILAF